MPKKKPPRRVHPPSVDEVNRLAAAMPDGLGPLILCMAWSGTRLSATCRLEKRDVTDCGAFAKLYLRPEAAKGGRERMAILLGPGWEAVRALPSYQLGDDQTRLFVRPEGNAKGAELWNRRTVWKKLDEVRRAIEMPGVISHDFRKFYATHLLNSGVSDVDVAVALGHLDSRGQPNTELVRLVYGFVNHDMALERAAEVANVISTGTVTRAAQGGAEASEPDQVVSGEGQARDQGGRVAADGDRCGSRLVAGEHEGVGGAGVGAEGRAREGEQDADANFRLAVEDARRALREAARGARHGADHQVTA